ncbi:helix-turn-helix domain-containing protein [Vibrio harveyi]|uniref:phage repressor protein CI n=1 Tax=Vibrio harveyi group TaxID=717610 RepID=UPI001EFD729A|nr:MULTISPECIES: phage repressor protein CI [Vibrio harveyi group]EGR3329462.1 chromosome partitioning protein ParA [Vibrio parahaemolyticus]MCG9609066.1 helix-turn-helix domain-containing protein [Vibrio harveyi]MCG9667099.1 helix-turn-helix domain-containing protein [Vibrio harveyi]MDI7848021.1 helix-turn-helix domain-containing protein [Vibrio parahaemolyticus]
MKKSLIPPFDYMKGSNFTKRLKLLTGCNDFQELSELLNVPKTTFSTWNSHDRTSHELIVRLHLALGIPVEELALNPEDRKHASEIRESTHQYIPQEPLKQVAPSQRSVVILPTFCLTNGQLIDTGEIPYPVRMFNSWNLDESNTIEIETNEARYLVDKRFTDAMSGYYLIDMSGRMSINHIQRLPTKLAVVFGDATVEVAEEDIKVVGRIAVTLKKD